MNPWPLLIASIIAGLHFWGEVNARMAGEYSPSMQPFTTTDFWLGLTLLMLAIYAAAANGGSR